MRIRYPARPRRPVLTAVVALLFLAGCTAGGDGNAPPQARLDVDEDEGWTGDEFVFDASGSRDADGAIESWRVDFGDGTPPVDVRDEQDAQALRHTYSRGGDFTVTLLVTDSGGDAAGPASDDDEAKVAVNERIPIGRTAISTVAGDDTGAVAEVPFRTYDDANRFALNLTFSNPLPAESSEFEVRVVDPDNATIGAPKSVTVDQGDDAPLELDGLVTREGAHRVIIEAKSGGGTAGGELRVYYGEDMPE